MMKIGSAIVFLALTVFGCAKADDLYHNVLSYNYNPGCCPVIVPQGTKTGSIIGPDTGFRGKVAIIADFGTCPAQPAGGFEWTVKWGDGSFNYYHADTLGPFQASHQYASVSATYSVLVTFCSTPPYGQSCCAKIYGKISFNAYGKRL